MNRSPLALSPRTVIFDYGEVISYSQSAADRAVIEQLAGVDPEKFWASYWAHRLELDLAVEGVREYWAAIAADTGADWDDGRVCELWLADYRSWLSVNPDVVGVLADLRAGGTRLALLSNAAPDFGSYFRHGIFGEYLDAVYVSGELRLLKPGAEIYRHVLDDLGIAASEAIFIDNRADNVRGAEELGITGHVFTDAATLRAFLESVTAASLPLLRARVTLGLQSLAIDHAPLALPVRSLSLIVALAPLRTSTASCPLPLIRLRRSAASPPPPPGVPGSGYARQ